MPSILKKPGDTTSPRIRSGVSLTRMLKLAGTMPAMSLNELWSRRMSSVLGRRRRVLVLRRTDASEPLPHHDEALGVVVRQRLEQDRVQHAEDGGFRTDAQGEGDDDDGAEDRVPQDEPEPYLTSASTVSMALP